jgi:YidC/Oxa1 family membrane protein insertase
MAVLFGYQLLFPPPPPPEPVAEQADIQQSAVDQDSAPTTIGEVAPIAVPTVPEVQEQTTAPTRPAKEIVVETDLYTAVFGEDGGTIRSFKLNNYREDIAKDSDLKELVKGGSGRELPLFFSWGADPARIIEMPIYEADQTRVTTSNGSAVLKMTGKIAGGLTAIRTITFNDDNYLLDLAVEVVNNSNTALQGSPYLAITSQPFSPESQNSRFLFNGPATLVNDDLEEVKIDDLKEDGQKTLQGNISWTAYEDTYFMLAVAPEKNDGGGGHKVRLSTPDGIKVSNIMSGNADIITPGASKTYRYTVYFGPKKMDGLEEAGHEFSRAIDFGWFGFVAKPVLVLLNLIYKVFHNYGVAIILVTVLIKLIFWPITQKGMKSMKNMQMLQPKLTKIREKYKGDKEKMAAEQMKLYQTHKINPLGGCLPMVLQIPVFFALYRVLMQAIELRHAPFMWWITDLSAPERLSIGFDLPYVGGLPLLTLVMGGSMFLQQKMTPTPAANQDMAKMMMFMPVIFTFLFINFASGLVLYFFINNMLQMAQQHLVNKSRK